MQIHEEIWLDLKYSVNTNHIIEKFSSPGKPVGLWHSCCSLLSKYSYTNDSLWLCHPAMNCLSAVGYTLGKMSLCPLPMKTWEDAFSLLQCHSEQLGSYWDKPEISPSLSCSCSRSLELLQNNSGHRFSSLDPLEIVLMGWNISEEDLKKTAISNIFGQSAIFFSQQFTSVWTPDGLCPFWYFSLLSLITANPLISHTALIPAHHLIFLHQNTV